MRPAFFFKEALRSIRRNPIPSFAAIASMLVTLLVLGVFIPMVQATTGAANTVRGRVLLDVYMQRDATSSDLERVRRRIADDTPHVKKVEFVSKAQAYKEESKNNPEAYRLLGSNPLPDTFRVTPDDPDNIGSILNTLAPRNPQGHRQVVDQSIDIVRNKKNETDKILTVTKLVKWAMVILTSLLVIASVLLVSNTIRLSLFARRREVEVMKLVGATDWFIRWPFVIEGVALGALGGLMAVLMLAVGKVALIDPLSKDFALIAAPRTMPVLALTALLLVASIAVSAAGSGLSLRRFLRV
jgi:cell division transport system permease protein